MKSPNYRLQKMWLAKSPKTPISQDPSPTNVANGSKHFLNLNDSTFTIFIDHFKDNCAGKSLF